MPGADWRPSLQLAVLAERSAFLGRIRDFFRTRNVLEVQTPVLMPGTVTEPMIDSIAVPGYGYLQVSPEYAMKRLLAAGAPAIYQLGPAFRDGERGRWHNPEFTLLEWYRPGFDDVALMAEVADLVNLLLGGGDFRAVRYGDLVNAAVTGDAADLAYAEACAELGGRVFVTHFLASQAALARLHDDGETAARFELIVNGVEVANGYLEAGNVVDLRARFMADNQRRRVLGKVQLPPDEQFLSAMTEGLPLVSGVAMGVDRLFMLHLGATHMDEVLTFRI
jgi:elongation factor P--(R)-beta-lysine ligase